MVLLPVDEDLKNKKDQYLDPNFTTEDGIEACKAALCVLIHRGQFDDATQLYDLLVGTGLFDISSYWQTGLLLARNTKRDPVGYLEAAHRICLNNNKIIIFLAYINELVVGGQRATARENIEVIWTIKHGSHPDVQDVLALLNVMDDPEKRLDYIKNRCKNIPIKSSFWPSWRPKDNQVAIEYLNYLRENDEEEMKKVSISILKKCGQAHNLDLMKVALKYHQPPLNPFDEWISLMSPYHELDPGADDNIFARPFVSGKLKRLKCKVGAKNSFETFKEIYIVLRDRLITVWFDRWAVKKIIFLCKSLLKTVHPVHRKQFSRIIEGDELHKYLQLRKTEIEKETLQEIEANYKDCDHETIMTLLGGLQDIKSILDKACELLERVQIELLTENDTQNNNSNDNTAQAISKPMPKLSRRKRAIIKRQEKLAARKEKESVYETLQPTDVSDTGGEDLNGNSLGETNIESINTSMNDNEPSVAAQIEEARSAGEKSVNNDEVTNAARIEQAPDALIDVVHITSNSVEPKDVPKDLVYSDQEDLYDSETEQGKETTYLPQCTKKIFEVEQTKKRVDLPQCAPEELEMEQIKKQGELPLCAQKQLEKKKKKKKHQFHQDSNNYESFIGNEEEKKKSKKRKKKRSRTEDGPKSKSPKQKKVRIQSQALSAIV